MVEEVAGVGGDAQEEGATTSMVHLQSELYKYERVDECICSTLYLASYKAVIVLT